MATEQATCESKPEHTRGQPHQAPDRGRSVCPTTSAISSKRARRQLDRARRSEPRGAGMIG